MPNFATISPPIVICLMSRLAVQVSPSCHHAPLVSAAPKRGPGYNLFSHSRIEIIPGCDDAGLRVRGSLGSGCGAGRPGLCDVECLGVCYFAAEEVPRALSCRYVCASCIMK